MKLYPLVLALLLFGCASQEDSFRAWSQEAQAHIEGYCATSQARDVEKAAKFTTTGVTTSSTWEETRARQICAPRRSRQGYHDDVYREYLRRYHDEDPRQVR